jgi:uncharacterized integral membrane protein (TIGR00697 family)
VTPPAPHTARFATPTAGLYPLLVAVFVALLLISNIGAVKLIEFGPIITDGGVFESVLGFVPRIVLASVCGFLVGQLLNAYVLVKIKERTQEKALWARLLGSTAVGEFADTLVFCTIAFFGVITGAEFMVYVVFGYLYKTAVEVILLPVTYRVIAAVKRREPTYVATFV